MDLNIFVRGQSNALLFADRGGAAALEQGLEARLGVAVHMLYQWGTDTSTIHSGTAFMDWDTDGQQASLLRYVRGLPADIKDNPTATVWMHNEYDQANWGRTTSGLTTNAWLGEVRADAALVRDALGQGAGTTPYTFVPIRYPWGDNFGVIKAGMETLDADPAFNAEISWAAWSLTMDGDGSANGGHMGDADAVQLGGSLAESMSGTLRPLAGGSSPSPSPSPTAPAPAQTTLGSGSDTLVLRISQDPYQGSAQYNVKVDGVQVGGTQTAVAWHSSGQSDTLTVKGDWASGSHGVAVEFLNDAWGGTATTDRNLYVDGMTYDGVAVANGSAALMSAGAVAFTVQDSTAVPGAAPPPAGPTISVSDTSVTEGGTLNYDVTLSAASTQTVTVAYATVDGTATGGTDYTAKSGTLSFAPGTASQPVAVVTTQDSTVEPNEMLILRLTSPTGGAAIGKADGTGTINNDDTTTTPPPSGTGQTFNGKNTSETITGTPYDDTIIGNRGNDTLTGGGGADDFVFYRRDGFDRIKDFVTGVDDIILHGVSQSQVSYSTTTYSGVSGLDVTYNGGSNHVFVEQYPGTSLAPGDVVFA